MLAVSSPADSQAQVPETTVPGSELTVYLVTVGPGSAVWERFGHNAIGIRDAKRGTDRVYNYGLFSFEQGGFLTRFLRGHMVYWVAGFNAAAHLRQYMAANRSLWVQELNLMPAQRLALRDFLEWNVLPENRFYAYDYYLDNCSTRVRDALDRVLGGAIQAQTAYHESDTSFRYHTRRVFANDPLLYTGIMLGLGAPADRPISRWEEMFLPEKVQEYLRSVEVEGPDGEPRPLVASERSVFVSGAEPIAPVAPRWLAGYLGLGLAAGAALVLLGQRSAASRWLRRGFFGLGAVWTLAVGVLGIILAGLWALTDHRTSFCNENLFLLNPLALVVAVGMAMSAWKDGCPSRGTSVLAFAVAVLSVVGFAVQALPALDQVNGEVYALVLPPNVAVVVGVLLGREPGGRGPSGWVLV
jgi:hypothetical protein